MSELYNLYQKVGNEGYGDAIGQIAPYFSTIHPRFVELRPGYCEILIKNQKSVHNHIGTMHAIAICNGAELVAGVMTDISIPDNHRWIPIGMTVAYTALADTDIRVVADGSDIDWSILGELVVPVVACKPDGSEVFNARITMKISQKKA